MKIDIAGNICHTCCSHPNPKLIFDHHRYTDSTKFLTVVDNGLVYNTIRMCFAGFVIGKIKGVIIGR